MASRRAIILESLDLWRHEGVLDEATYATLRARYEAAPDEDEPRDERASFGLLALQLVGGLLLGAAAVAAVVFANLKETQGALALEAVALAALAGGFALHRYGPAGREGLGDAALAASLVAATVGGFFPPERDAWAALLAAAIALAATLLSRGRSAIVALAGIAFSVATARAVVIPSDGSNDTLRHALWGLAVVAYAGLLVGLWRRIPWTSVALAVLVAPFAMASAFLLRDLGVTNSVAVELALGALLALVLGLGIWLSERGLVAGAAAGLLIDAIAFAFDVGGAGTALVVLLALGGLLVWQAEFLRGYFRRRNA